MSQRRPGVPGCFVTIKNHSVDMKPLGAIHPRMAPRLVSLNSDGFCVAVLFALESPFTIKVSKMFYWCVFFAAHTKAMTVKFKKKADAAAFTSLLPHRPCKTLKIDFIFSPQRFVFLSPRRNTKLLFFRLSHWSMGLIQSVRRRSLE